MSLTRPKKEIDQEVIGIKIPFPNFKCIPFKCRIDCTPEDKVEFWIIKQLIIIIINNFIIE